MTKTLTFDADAKHQLEVDGRTVAGGESFTVSDERAAELLADPSIPLKEEALQLSKLTREKLDELARERSIDPAQHKTKSELIEAIEAPPADHTQPQATS